MTTEEIARQIVDCARTYAAAEVRHLPTFSASTPAMREAIERQFQAAYLSGVSQTASFLARGDGLTGVTPQNIMSAATLAGKELGFIERPGKEGTRG